NGDLSLTRPNSVRYPTGGGKPSAKQQQQPENSYLTTNSNNTGSDNGSTGSPSAQSAKLTPISESALQADQTHDSFRGSETTANSRDSVKSSDSDAMSSYAVSQCSTPSTSWKMG